MTRVSPPELAREFPGAPGVHHGDLGAAPEQFERRPAAEGAGAHHDRADAASGLGSASAPGGGFCRFAGVTPGAVAAGGERPGGSPRGKSGRDRFAA